MTKRLEHEYCRYTGKPMRYMEAEAMRRTMAGLEKEVAV